MNDIKQLIPDRKETEKEYEKVQSRNEKVIYDLQKRMIESIKRKSIHSTVKARVKSFDSYYIKLLKRLKEFGEMEKAFLITDILGLRIVCPFLEIIKIVESIIEEEFELIESEHKGIEHSFKEFGYVSTHHLIKIPKDLLSYYHIEDAMVCEIQICTILQDAWAEVEHELVYKNEDFSPFDVPLKRKLAALNANLSLSDILFQEIRDHQRKLKRQLKNRRKTFFEKIEFYETLSLDPDLIKIDTIGMDFQEENGKSEFLSKDIKDNVKYSADDLMLEALDAHNRSKFSNAIDLYSKILEFNLPVNIQVIVHIHRGMAYFGKFDYLRSLKDFADALVLDKNNYKALYCRGIIQRVLHNYQFALDDLNMCIQIEPYKFYPYLNRAQVYFFMCHFERALEDCEQALKIYPDSEKAQKFKEVLKNGMEINKFINDY